MKKIKLNNDLIDAVSKCACPTCGEKLNGRTQIGGADENIEYEVYGNGPQATPADGDTSLCLYCKTKLVFYKAEDGYLRVRPMTEEEYEAMPQYVKDALSLDIEELVEGIEQREESAPDFFAKWTRLKL